jgi:hypothetical protein
MIIFLFLVKQVLVFYDITNQNNVYYPSIKIVIISYYGVNVKLQYVSLIFLSEIISMKIIFAVMDKYLQTTL